jgi:hypothetical protein
MKARIRENKPIKTILKPLFLIFIRSTIEFILFDYILIHYDTEINFTTRQEVDRSCQIIKLLGNGSSYGFQKLYFKVLTPMNATWV